MPDIENKKLTDLKVGDKVVANRGYFKHDQLDRDAVYTITALHPHGNFNTAGTVSLEGVYANDAGDLGYAPGSFGFMLFDKVADANAPIPPAPREMSDTIHPVGSRVVITDVRTTIGGGPLGSGTSPYVGKEGTVTRAPDGPLANENGRQSYRVEIDGDGFKSSWTHNALDAVEVPVPEVEVDDTPARPLVHFNDKKAGVNRGLARDYAREAISRTLDPKHNAVLGAAANGESVDAYAFNAAVLAAMRSATTRLGQSTGRRKQAEHFAHLGHIVQAVLENHADNLPTYADKGVRSRQVEELRQEITTLKIALVSLRDERTTLTQAASDERRRLCADIDDLRAEIAEFKDIRDRLVSEVDVLRANLSQSIGEANESEAVIEFMLSIGEPEEIEAVKAGLEFFRRGYRVGAQD